MRGFLLHDLDDDGQISGEPEHTVGMKPAETGHTQRTTLAPRILVPGKTRVRRARPRPATRGPPALGRVVPPHFRG